MSPVLTALLVAAGLAVLFQITFWWGRRLHNFGIVDAVWALSFTPVAALVTTLGTGWLPRRLALLAVAGAWSMRLGVHLARRIASHHPVEDTRYHALREKWRQGFDGKMMLFFQGQGLSVLLLSLPYWFIGYNAAPSLSPLEIGALVLWALAWTGEAVADRQLAAFQADPARRGQVCNAGLWRYSRHPNYFFEWLGWVALALAASTQLPGLWSWISPALMLHLLLNVTGVPLTEERSLARRGDAYRRYQASTSAFFPWFPRSSPPSSTP